MRNPPIISKLREKLRQLPEEKMLRHSVESCTRLNSKLGGTGKALKLRKKIIELMLKLTVKSLADKGLRIRADDILNSPSVLKAAEGDGALETLLSCLYRFVHWRSKDSLETVTWFVEYTSFEHMWTEVTFSIAQKRNTNAVGDILKIMKKDALADEEIRKELNERLTTAI